MHEWMESHQMKFLCDHMLSRLGKWLRAAGYDTLIITTSISDHEVLTLALSDARLLITRDRHFLKMKQADPILIYLKNNEFEKCIQELNQRIPLNWLYAPFSRCLNCNTLLEKPSLDITRQIPPRIREEKTRFWYCPICQHVYWEGSHTIRMLFQLTQWQKDVHEHFS